MTKLDIYRKSKSLFMKWRLHGLIEPFSGFMQNAYYMSKMSKWRRSTKVTGYNDWYQTKWDYNRRHILYQHISQQEELQNSAIDYFEFGVAGGHSFRWWLEHNKNAGSRFFGFDTFEGLPEDFGHLGKGSLSAALEALNITDSRATFYKGLFQDTLIPFLEKYQNGKKKLIHMDADIFSATIFSLSQLYRFLNEGDIIFFDEFAVPTHEFKAFHDFVQAYHIDLELIAAANNYYFVAFKIV